jgi:DNA (cytosine-5)-methyltransferase 1
MEKGSGTRSGLLWEIERILDECEELPQILLMENVPQVTGEKNRDAFRDWFCKLESLGYKSWYTIMNGKDCEIPQNRERCFMVSALGDYCYEFTNPKPLKLRLKDMIENEVDEKYYLSENAINGMLKSTFNQGGLEARTEKDGIIPSILARDYKDPKVVIEPHCEQVGQEIKIVEDKTKMFQYPRGENKGGILEVDACPTITTCSWENNCMLVEDEVKIAVNSATKSGYEIAEVGDSIDIAYPNSKTRRGRVGKEVAQTLMTSDQIAVLTDEPRFYDYYNKTEIGGEYCGTLTTGTAHNGSGTFFVQRNRDYRIRKLTPKECFRLMGVKDEDFERVAKNQSNSSLYHLAGDSIITNCLMAIFKEML